MTVLMAGIEKEKSKESFMTPRNGNTHNKDDSLNTSIQQLQSQESPYLNKPRFEDAKTPNFFPTEILSKPPKAKSLTRPHTASSHLAKGRSLQTSKTLA